MIRKSALAQLPYFETHHYDIWIEKILRQFDKF
jgi:hypothetical protein